MQWMTSHVLSWTVAAASTLTVAQFFTPNFMDFILDWLVVGLVFVAAKLAKMQVEGTKK